MQKIQIQIEIKTKYKIYLIKIQYFKINRISFEKQKGIKVCLREIKKELNEG